MYIHFFLDFYVYNFMDVFQWICLNLAKLNGHNYSTVDWTRSNTTGAAMPAIRQPTFIHSVAQSILHNRLIFMRDAQLVKPWIDKCRTEDHSTNATSAYRSRGGHAV